MCDYNTYKEFNQGIASGIVLSLLIWIYQILSRKIHIIRCIQEDDNFEKIVLKNVGFQWWHVPYIEVIAQISFLHGTIRNRYTLKVEHANPCISPFPLDGLEWKTYLKYLFFRKEKKDEIIKAGRKLLLEYSDVHVSDNNDNFICFQDFKKPQYNYNDVHVIVYITYFGKLTNLRKTKSFKLYSHN